MTARKPTNKAFWRSKTIGGISLAFVPQFLPFLPPEAQALVSAVGAIWAIYGRIKASGTITAK